MICKVWQELEENELEEKRQKERKSFLWCQIDRILAPRKDVFSKTLS